MSDHPCQDGLTAACFAAEPRWAKQALAYKLLHMFLPKQLSKRLPAGLGRALIGPGVQLPAGVNLPPGMIVPPGTTWRSDWNPWLNFVYDVFDQWDTLIAMGWTPGDPLPPGFILPPGVTMPAGGFASLADAAAWLSNYLATLTAGGAPGQPPLYVAPFEAGPIGGSKTSGGPETTVTVPATAGGRFYASGAWATIQNAANATGSAFTTNIATNISVDVLRNATASREIHRTVFGFDLTGIPVGKTCKSASLVLTGTGTGNATSIIQRAPGVVLYGLGTYSKMTGTGSDQVPYATGANTFTLPAAIRSYLATVFGDAGWLMIREAPHDYDNAEPSGISEYNGEFYTPRFSNGALRPQLTLTYR